MAYVQGRPSGRYALDAAVNCVSLFAIDVWNEWRAYFLNFFVTIMKRYARYLHVHVCVYLICKSIWRLTINRPFVVCEPTGKNYTSAKTAKLWTYIYGPACMWMSGLSFFLSPSIPQPSGCFVVVTITAVLYKLWTCRKLNFSFYFLGSCVGVSGSNGESAVGRGDGATRGRWEWKKVMAIRTRALYCVVPGETPVVGGNNSRRVTIGDRGTISNINIVWVLPICHRYTEYNIYWKSFFLKCLLISLFYLVRTQIYSEFLISVTDTMLFWCRPFQVRDPDVFILRQVLQSNR